MLKYDLQMFAEDDTQSDKVTTTDNDTIIEDVITEDDEHIEDEHIEEKPKPKTYTKEEMENILKSRIKRERLKFQSEADKLKNMTEDEKTSYQISQLNKELEELKSEKTRNEFTKQVRSILSENGIVADENIASYLISDTAEETLERTNEFISLFNSTVEATVKERLKGKSIKVKTGNSKLSKDEIMAITDIEERQKLIRENLELFQK